MPGRRERWAAHLEIVRSYVVAESAPILDRIGPDVDPQLDQARATRESARRNRPT